MYDTLTNSAALFQSEHQRPNYWISRPKLAYVNDGVLLMQQHKSVIFIQLNFKTFTAHRFRIYNLDLHRKYTNDLFNSHTNLLVCLPALRQVSFPMAPMYFHTKRRFWIANIVANDVDDVPPHTSPYRFQVAHF